MTYGSLFSGVGGFDLGFDRAGMVCKWQVERDKACREVLSRHWPDVPKHNDVTEVGRHNLEPVDVVCGGFPCQDLSSAGRRAGLAGERSGLWFEFHRILDELRPSICVIENVPGLLSSRRGADFAIVVQGLVELGYRVCWRVLDSRYFGVAQRRRRVFIVGSLGDGRCAQILLEPEGVRGDSSAKREAGQEVAGTLGGGPGSRGWSNSADVTAFVPQVVSRLNASMSKGKNGQDVGAYIAFAQNQRDEVRMMDVAGESSSQPGMKQQTYVTFSASQGMENPMTASVSRTLAVTHNTAVLAPTLLASGAGASRPAGIGSESDFCVPVVAPPITASNDPSRSPQSSEVTAQVAGVFSASMKVRRLTPSECEVLQGFPKGWTSGRADGPRYKQMGNAVTVNVAEWIGRRIVNL